MLTRMDSGMETTMIMVLFQLPRKSRIIMAVRTAAISASRRTPWIEARTNTRLVEELGNFHAFRVGGFVVIEHVLHAIDDI